MNDREFAGNLFELALDGCGCNAAVKSSAFQAKSLILHAAMSGEFSRLAPMPAAWGYTVDRSHQAHVVVWLLLRCVSRREFTSRRRFRFIACGNYLVVAMTAIR